MLALEFPGVGPITFELTEEHAYSFIQGLKVALYSRKGIYPSKEDIH